jgi:outer membrane protein assembly factor BamB
MVYALDFDSGKIVWEREVHRGIPPQSRHDKNTFAAETPVTDGEHLYAYFGNVGLFCLDRTGKIVWKKSWDPVATRLGWGTAASPILHQDRVYVVNDNDTKSYLTALDKKTGQTIWTVDRAEESNWATPYIWQNAQRTEIITPGTKKVRSYDLDGKLLWELGGMSSIAIPTPFAAHGMLYITSGYVADQTRPYFAIKPGAKGDISLKPGETANAHIAWHLPQAGPYNPSPLVYGDTLFTLLDRGFLTAHNAKTGAELFGKQRIDPAAGAFTASPWAYNGKVFAASEDGDTFVMAAAPTFQLLHKNSLNEMIMATPAIARGSLFIRTYSKLYRITNKPAAWDRFRGPNGAGVAETGPLPADFGPGKNNSWKVALPPGHSSPIVVDGRVLLTAFEGDQLLTIALDQRTGQTLWRQPAPRPRQEPLDKRNSPASPSPVSDGQRVYVFFPDYGLLAYSLAGQLQWSVPLGPFDNSYGMGASPILAGDKVVLVCDQNRNSFAIAFDRATGKQRWRTARPEALSGHSTPVLYQPAQGPAQIVAPGSFRMDAYSEEDGRVVWSTGGLASEMKSVPVLAADGTIFINGYNIPDNDPGKQIQLPTYSEAVSKYDSNKNGKLDFAELTDEKARKYFDYLDFDKDKALDADEWKSFALTLSAENGLLAVEAGTGRVKWKYHRGIPQLPSTLLYQDVLYMITDSGILTTLRPSTGEVLKQGRIRGSADNYYAAPVASDGKVFFASKSGVVTVLKAGGEQEALAQIELDDEIYSTPAIADGRIYIRTRSALYAFGS